MKNAYKERVKEVTLLFHCAQLYQHLYGTCMLMRIDNNVVFNCSIGFFSLLQTIDIHFVHISNMHTTVQKIKTLNVKINN